MKQRPPFIRNWRTIETAEHVSRASSEVFGRLADFGRAAELARLKMMHLRLPPGTRSNAPGAYRNEEEFVFVFMFMPVVFSFNNA